MDIIGTERFGQDKSEVCKTVPGPNLTENLVEELTTFHRAIDSWHLLGFATLDMHERSLPIRYDRGKLFHQVMALKQNPQVPIGGAEREAQRVDYIRFRRIECEFSHQSALEIESPWGVLRANYVILNKEAAGDKPPVVIITGASNGIESVDSLVRRMALRMPDRQLYVSAYPDAPSGEITQKFNEVVRHDMGLGPHTWVFRRLIEHLVPQGDMELWGYSAGGAVAASLMMDEVFASRVRKMVLVCPGGSVEQSVAAFNINMILEVLLLLKHSQNLARYFYASDPTSGEQKEWKLDTLFAIRKKICQPLVADALQKMCDNYEGKIVIVSGGWDRITRSAKLFGVRSDWGENVATAVIPRALHVGPLLEPDRFLDKALELLGDER